MLPLMAVAMPLILLSFWSLFISPYLTLVCVCLLGLAYFWMRKVSSHDDQRLLQLLKRFLLRVAKHVSAKHWGAITYSPIKYKKRNRK